MTLLGTVIFSVSNMCRNNPAPGQNIVEKFIEPLVQLLEKIDSTPETTGNTELRRDICWALSHLSDNGEERAQAVMDANPVPLLINHLAKFADCASLIIPTLRTIGNCVAGTDEQTEVILRANFLKYAFPLLEHRSVRPFGV